MTTLTEADVEHAAVDWLADLGWRDAHKPGHCPGLAWYRAGRLRPSCAGAAASRRLGLTEPQPSHVGGWSRTTFQCHLTASTSGAVVRWYPDATEGR